ncbi:sigma-70 family RNA polymerase sigma factor [Paenibacillus sp. IB182496]|uniref:Sigma-70 family RNA polymerase sigma factor n=2 Tax=Paenibacillus sabuli TaxID=2772509 RepID=A0A927BRF7_9BACL|nr:sigma-70 family RNA polymerase sigma factor [Paenibacillus sabuli]
MRRIAGRDNEALEALYDRYERPVYSFVFRMVKDPMAAEEVVQELFMRIWHSAERVHTGGSQGKVSTWMFAVARNLAIDWLRKKGRRPQETQEEAAWERVADGVSTEQAVERRMLGEEMQQAIGDLNEDQQQVLNWIYFLGYTQQEVASRENIPLGTVKSRVRLALKQLRKRFDHGRKEGAWQ